MLLGALAALPLAFTGFPGLSGSLSSVEWGSVGAASWATAAYSTVLCSSFAIAAYQANVARRGANRVLVYLNLQTLVGLLASVVLLGRAWGRQRWRGGGHPAWRLPCSPRLEAWEGRAANSVGSGLPFVPYSPNLAERGFLEVRQEDSKDSPFGGYADALASSILPVLCRAGAGVRAPPFLRPAEQGRHGCEEGCCC